MKQRVRETNGILWLPKPIASDIAEMDANYKRVSPNQLKWTDDNYTPPEKEEEVEEAEVEIEEPTISATAEELLAEESE